jgi:anti-sigma regulatory factor (Ser/Thr protein kinase)
VWVRDIVASAGNVVHAATVELLVSELATNAVRYGGGEVFRVEFYNRFLIVVTDAGTEPICSPHFAHEGGRGLGIVDALAARLGVEVHPGGTRVWFQLGGAPTVQAAHG